MRYVKITECLRKDRRRFRRVNVALTGRFMRPDLQEFPCETINVSAGNIAVQSAGKVEIGNRVITYLDELGRIEGTVARIFDNGFALTINATLYKREKLIDKLVWLGNQDKLYGIEARGHVRIKPDDSNAILVLEDGRQIECQIVDMSVTGAALAIDFKPDPGAAVKLGKLPAKVVRHIDGGIAIQFENIDYMDDILDHMR